MQRGEKAERGGDAGRAIGASARERRRGTSPPGRGRGEILLFLAAFLAFAWFHPGGGWNQNARFALVRSLVEQGTPFIDEYLVYARPAPGETRLPRLAVRDGAVEIDGERRALAWTDDRGGLVRVEPSGTPTARAVALKDVAASGDVAYVGGRFHPNKAPGTSLLAVPGYAILYASERLLGIDPDDWWALTVNAWLASALSVGLVAALGVVVFFRLARRFADGDYRAAMLAALTLAFGTMYFVYATALYEHDVVAVGLLAAWALAGGGASDAAGRGVRAGAGGDRTALAWAGACAGGAAVASYVAAAPVAFLGVYVLHRCGVRGLMRFALGALGPFALLCAYNAVCFGTPFTTNYAHQNPTFVSRDAALLGVFSLPSAAAMLGVLVSPFRGLFVTSPVLVLGVAGIAWLARDPRWRADAALCAAIAAFFVFFNVTFEAWHGGWAVGPRYLTPALPFLALPLVVAYRRHLRATAALAAVSVAMTFVVVAVDPQSPIGVGAAVPGRALWTYSPLTEYELPLLLSGRATPLLGQQADAVVAAESARWARDGLAPAEIEARRRALAAELERRIERGDPDPLPLASIAGPVSANPVGVHEAAFFRHFAPGSAQARWSSFNAGELAFPGSRWSLVPLLLLAGAAAALALRRQGA